MADDTTAAPGADQGDEIPLEDLPDNVRSQLPYNAPALNDYADRLSNKLGFPGLMNAIKNAGERSNSDQVSPKGATGVMQFIPDTAARYGYSVADMKDPVKSMDAAGQYLMDIAKKLNTTDPGLIAAGFNAGENRPSLKRGEIPPIKETQEYVQRVLNHRNQQFGDEVPATDVPNTSATTGNGADSLQQQPDIRALVSQQGPDVHSTPGQANTTRQIWMPFGPNMTYNVNPKLANVLASMDRGVTDPVIGIAQRGKEIANKLANNLGIGDIADPGYANQGVRDKYDAPMLHTPQGYLGYGVGSGIDAGLMAAMSPWAAGTGLVRAGLTGAAAGATMPVSNPNDVAINAGAGAVLGPLTQIAGNGFGTAASKIANLPGVKQAIAGVGNLVDKIPGIPGVLDHSIAGSLPGPQRAAVQRALDQDIPVWQQQITKPGTELTKSQVAAQGNALDRAASRTFGQNTDDLTTAMQQGAPALSAGYGKLLDNRTFPPASFDHLADIADLIDKNNSRLPRFQPNPEVADTLQRAFDSAKPSAAPMTGRDFQQAQRDYSALATRLSSGTPTNPSDPAAAKLIVGLMDAMNKEAGRSMTPAEQAQFRQLNTQWRNMVQLEPLVPRDANANMNPKAFASMLARKRPDEFLYGEGDQTLPDLGRFGATYMNLTPKPKVGAWNTVKQMAKSSAPFLVGDIGGGVAAGVAAGQQSPDMGGVAKDIGYGIPLGLAAIGGNAYRKRLLNPQLSSQSFNAARGAIPQVARGLVSPGALTRLVDAENSGD